MTVENITQPGLPVPDEITHRLFPLTTQILFFPPNTYTILIIIITLIINKLYASYCHYYHCYYYYYY